MGKLGKTSIDRQFQDQVRGMLQPGTSALFLMLEKVTPEMRRLARVQHFDFWIAIAAIIATLLVGVLAGVIIGIGLSLIWLISVATRPRMPSPRRWF